jgi:PadR family transcriptional regulator PadR
MFLNEAKRNPEKPGFCRRQKIPQIFQKRKSIMVFNTGTALLDAVVLSVVAQETEGTYGYKITQDVRKIMDVSESTLYPVLRRLQKDNFLETYDMEFAGRNRRYYRLTSNGMIKLDEYRKSWIEYKQTIDEILLGVNRESL